MKRIAWFTPLSIKTGIAKYSLSAIEALSKFYKIDVWTENKDDDYLLSHIFPVYEIRLDHSFFEILENYDFVVYNMGNNINFHEKIYEVYKKKKGIVIAHDKVMHHFFASLYIEKYEKRDLYVTVMKKIYGKDGESSAKALTPVWGTEEVLKYPLIEQCLWNATGIIVLSKESLAQIQKLTPVPCAAMSYPFYKEQEIASQTRKELCLPEDKTIIIQYGHIVPNKNTHKVIEAISKDNELKESIFFVIAGNYDGDYAHRIKKMAYEKGLSNNVLFTGYIDDTKLYNYIRNSDLCINLRYPSLEGASWSVIEQMYFGKPVIATKIGFFDEIPDEYIIKIDPPVSIYDLTNCIKKFLRERELMDKMALNASNFVLQNFSREKYAAEFSKFIEKVSDYRNILDFIDNITDEASVFTDAQNMDRFVERVCKELAFLDTVKNTL